MALTIERHGHWDAAVTMWDTYLTGMVQSGTWSDKGPDVSRVLLHMAELLPPDIDELLEFLEVRSTDELRSLIRAGALPACFDRRALLERALAADPDPRVFRVLVADDETRRPKLAVATAEAFRPTGELSSTSAEHAPMSGGPFADVESRRGGLPGTTTTSPRASHRTRSRTVPVTLTRSWPARSVRAS